MQTILGAGGSVGKELARELKNYTEDIRIVGRNPKKVNDNDQLLAADLTDPEMVDKAVEGSEVVYVVIGFEYKTSVWEKLWIPFISSVVDACEKHHAHLVFFDNIYMYNPDYLDGMTEKTPFHPVSKKGKIREKVARIIIESYESGRIRALIARAPDFLSESNSMMTEMVISNHLKRKKAMWLCNADKCHNFIFMPDAAKATAILGNSPEAYNRTWHLPVDPTRITGRQWAEMSAELTGTTGGVKVISHFMLAILGLFIPVMREIKEMAYQYDRDYLFISREFEEKFNFTPAPAKEALAVLISGLQAQDK